MGVVNVMMMVDTTARVIMVIELSPVDLGIDAMVRVTGGYTLYPCESFGEPAVCLPAVAEDCEAVSCEVGDAATLTWEGSTEFGDTVVDSADSAVGAALLFG